MQEGNHFVAMVLLDDHGGTCGKNARTVVTPTSVFATILYYLDVVYLLHTNAFP